MLMMPEFQRNFSAWSILLKASVEANAIEPKAILVISLLIVVSTKIPSQVLCVPLIASSSFNSYYKNVIFVAVCISPLVLPLLECKLPKARNLILLYF